MTDAELDELIAKQQSTMPKSKNHGVRRGRYIKGDKMTKPTKPSFQYREVNGEIEVYDPEDQGTCGGPAWRTATREEEQQVREWNVQQAAEEGAR